MNIKKTALILFPIMLILFFCACSTETTPLYEHYQSEKIKTLNADLPVSMDISIIENERTSSIYDVGDKELIKRVADAFMKIEATQEAKVEDFTGKYYVEFFWKDEKVRIQLSDTVAEIINENSISYYKIKGGEEFFSILNAEIENNNKTTENHESVINESGITVDIMDGLVFDEDGKCFVNINVVNGTDSIIGVVISGIKVNGIEKENSPVLGVQSKTELGFKVPIDTTDIEKVEKVTFRFEIGYGTGEPISPFITSEEHTLTADN